MRLPAHQVGKQPGKLLPPKQDPVQCVLLPMHQASKDQRRPLGPMLNLYALLPHPDRHPAARLNKNVWRKATMANIKATIKCTKAKARPKDTTKTKRDMATVSIKAATPEITPSLQTKKIKRPSQDDFSVLNPIHEHLSI